jgi:hypothetical protein
LTLRAVPDASPPAADIVAYLRQMADDIERGAYDGPVEVATVLNGPSGLSIGGAGINSDVGTIHLLLSAGALRLAERVGK